MSYQFEDYTLNALPSPGVVSFFEKMSSMTGVSPIQRYIQLFNQFAFAEANRANHAQLMKYYNLLKPQFGRLTAAQVKGLNEKLWAFEARLRVAEGRPAWPVTTTAPQIITPTTAPPIQYLPIAPWWQAGITIGNTRIPIYAIVGGAGMLLLLITVMGKKKKRR